jgi:hypothetical protein
MSSKTFIYDYFALEGEDIPNWHDSFFWPVPRETTTQITLDVVDMFSENINRLGNTFEGDCLVIGHLLATDIIRVVNHSLVVQRLQQEGYTIQTSRHLQFVPNLIRNQPPGVRHPDMWRRAREPGLVRSFKDLALSIRYNLGKRTLNVTDHFCPNRRVFAFSNENVVGRPYLMRHPDWVRLTSPEEWLDPSLSSPPSDSSMRVFTNVAQELVVKTMEYSRDSFGLELRGVVAGDLEQMVVEGLRHIAEVYSALSLRAAKLKPQRVLSPTGGNPFTRSVNLAVRRNGGKATGHPHGYYICHHTGSRLALQELATVDEFMAYTPGSVPLFKSNMELNPIPRNNPVAINHDNYDGHLRRWNAWKDRPLSKRIRTVMVLELSLIPEWAGYNAAESMVNYHFYYSLCRTLSDRGYNVIFKRRPKAPAWQGTNIFSGIPNVEVEYSSFEEPDVIDRADAVIIQYAMSSTFYFSMCTNKTVIYADSGWEPWFPEVYQSMAKRCRILKCWYDDRNRQCFSEEELLELLETPPSKPDTDFLEKYLFPENEHNMQ